MSILYKLAYARPPTAFYKHQDSEKPYQPSQTAAMDPHCQPCQLPPPPEAAAAQPPSSPCILSSLSCTFPCPLSRASDKPTQK